MAARKTASLSTRSFYTSTADGITSLRPWAWRERPPHHRSGLATHGAYVRPREAASRAALGYPGEVALPSAHLTVRPGHARRLRITAEEIATVANGVTNVDTDTQYAFGPARPTMLRNWRAPASMARSAPLEAVRPAHVAKAGRASAWPGVARPRQPARRHPDAENNR